MHVNYLSAIGKTCVYQVIFLQIAAATGCIVITVGACLQNKS